MAASITCRLCALTCNDYYTIFSEETEKLKLADKIKQCLQISIFPEDVLPKYICMDCYQKIEQYFDFFNFCSQNQTSLMDLFSKDNDPNKGTSLDVFAIVEKDAGIFEINELVANDVKGQLIYVDAISSVNKEESDEELSKEVVTLNKKFSILARSDTKRMSKSQDSPIKETCDEETSDQDDDSFEDVNGSQSNGKKLFEDYNWKCTNCDKELSSVSALKLHHQEAHNQSPHFMCVQCSKVYTRYRSFARHVKLHADSRRYSCGICGKCFSQKTVLQSHRTVHSEERPHVCSQCGKAFKQFSSLYLHTKCHLPEEARPKYPCTLCGKVFSSKHTLDTHTKMHTGEKNYICDICGKRFVSKGSLDYHISGHDESKPHSCPVCGKGFKTARLLGKHSTVHTGVKPHQCDVCGKQFRERGALREHNRIHTGDMPYSCNYCGKSFRFKGILTVHLRLHTGERPYSCSECRREFTNWANYNKHMKRRHKTSGQAGGGGTSRIGTGPPPGPVEVPPPPPYSDSPSAPPPPPPPPPYKLPVSEDSTLWSAYGGPPLQMAYYLHPLHTIPSTTRSLPHHSESHI